LEKAAASGAPLLARVGDGGAGAFERAAAAVAKGDAAALERLVFDESTLDALGPFGADVLWALLRATQDNLARSASVRLAARAGLALGERYPDDPRAGAALGLAASSAQRLASIEGDAPESLELYERVLRAAFAHAERASEGALRVDSLR